MTRISVVIPAYNCSQYIAETIESVLHQSFRPLEIIVVDDGSTDTTSEVVQKYQHLVKYVHQDNRGATSARNAAIRIAEGDFVAFLDNDDVWRPEKLSQQLAAFRQYPEAALVFTDAEWFRDDGSTIRFAFGKRPQERGGATPAGLKDQIGLLEMDDGQVVFGDWYPDLLSGNFITISSVLVRRSALLAIGGGDEDLVLNSDYDLWLRIADKFPLAYLNRAAVKYRVRDNAMSGHAARRHFAYARWDAKLFEKHLRVGRPEFQPKIAARIAACYQLAAWGYFYHGSLDEARALNSQARSYVRLDPSLYWHAACLLLPDAIVERIRGTILGLRRTAKRVLMGRR